MLKRLLIAVLVSLGISGAAHSTECDGKTMQTLVRYLPGGVKADDAPRLIRALEIVWQWPGPETAALQDLVKMLNGRSIVPVSGEANPLHIMRSFSGWTNDPAGPLLYFQGLDFFRVSPNAIGQPLKPGLDLAYPTLRSTCNLRRVAGAAEARSVAEAWEVVAMYMIVTQPGQFRTMGAFRSLGAPGQLEIPLFFSHADVESFGRKVGNVEADVWLDSQRVLFDMKHTVGNDPFTSISDSLILRWRDELSQNRIASVFIPVNQPPDDILRMRMAALIGDPDLLARIDFVVMPGIL